jgi:uncharacterized protein
MRRFTVVILIFISACAHKNELTPEELQAYKKEIDAWHSKRIENVSAPNGWLNLVGLYWLEPGINTFGSSSKNKIVFPKGKIAEQAGYFLVKGNQVEIYIHKGVNITADGHELTNQTIYTLDSTPIMLSSGSLRWNVIKRDDKLAIRLRDDASITQKKFSGIERYPIWTIKSKLHSSKLIHCEHLMLPMSSAKPMHNAHPARLCLSCRENSITLMYWKVAKTSSLLL